MTRSILTLLAVCVLALPAAGQERDHGDLLGPLPVRDQYLLSNGFFFFEPAPARVLASNDWLVDVHSADSNTFAKSRWISHNLAGDTDRRTGSQTLGIIRMDEGQTVFLVDGEIHRTTITAHHGLGANLEVGIAIPFATIGGGTSDGFIERFHAAFHLGDNQRVAMQRNRETVYVHTDERTYFREHTSGAQIGDIALSAKYELTALEDPQLAISIESAIELPTGDAQTLDGSGSLDGGVQLLATRDYGRSRIHASAGVLVLGHNGPLGTKSQFVITDSIGISSLIAGRTSATAQVTISQSPFRTIGAPELTRRSYQMTVGLQHAIGRSLIAWAGIVENLITYQNSADAGFVWGIARRF
ncbi:MAG: hypothetical protein QOK37_1178 [Thermoanaerobaculia bacterium]|jgi:hypothetical protein|nr:hypothetical protein [Thermoanaerobaculia bacterium]